MFLLAGINKLSGNSNNSNFLSTKGHESIRGNARGYFRCVCKFITVNLFVCPYNIDEVEIMKLILARHGETEFNRLRKFYGTANVEIDEKGKEQAKLLATKVNKLYPTLFVVTNLKRTVQTLVPLKEQRPTVPTIVLPDFAEKGFGCWEGLDANEIENRYPDEWEKWLAAPLTYTPPTIEAFSDFKERVNYGLRWLLDHTMENDVVFIVAHLGSIRIIYQELVDPTADFYSLNFPASCYSVINLKNGIVQNWYLNQ